MSSSEKSKRPRALKFNEEVEEGGSPSGAKKGKHVRVWVDGW